VVEIDVRAPLCLGRGARTTATKNSISPLCTLLHSVPTTLRYWLITWSQYCSRPAITDLKYRFHKHGPSSVPLWQAVFQPVNFLSVERCLLSAVMFSVYPKMPRGRKQTTVRGFEYLSFRRGPPLRLVATVPGC
jgi:hypothetical protein